jgi:predicted phage tail protein
LIGLSFIFKKEKSMSKKTIGFLLIILGVVVLVVSLTADVTGLGPGNGIGWKQILGAVIGVIVALGGVWLALNKPTQKM